MSCHCHQRDNDEMSNQKKKLVHIAGVEKIERQIERQRHQRGRCPGKKIGPLKAKLLEKKLLDAVLVTNANKMIVGADCSMRWNFVEHHQGS